MATDSEIALYKALGPVPGVYALADYFDQLTAASVMRSKLIGLTAQVPIARQHPCLDGINTITSASGNNTANVRQFFFAPASSGVTDIVLKFAGFYEGFPEANLPIGYTVTAAIEYPLGTFTQVLFGGTTSQAVAPGRLVYSSDPVPVYIPAGGKAAVKLFVSWTGSTTNLPLTNCGVNSLAGEWLSPGVGLADLTMSATTQANVWGVPFFTGGVGFGCGIYGTLGTPVPIIGAIGDSITQGIADNPDPLWGGTSVERGLRSSIPWISLHRQSESFTSYLTRTDGRATLLRNSATHLMVWLGRNDITSNHSLATIQGDFRTTIAPYIARGMKVYTATITPISTSTDSWATVANQAVSSAPQEAIRVAYNAWLRANYTSLGLAGVFDWAHAVDPNDTGLWPADGSAGRNAVGAATLTANTVTAVVPAVFSVGTAAGTGYPISQAALPCAVYRYPDDPIQLNDAVITCTTSGTGTVTSYTVVSGGSYTIPPMVTPIGQWVSDGTHPTMRCYNQIISATGFSASKFSL